MFSMCVVSTEGKTLTTLIMFWGTLQNIYTGTSQKI